MTITILFAGRLQDVTQTQSHAGPQCSLQPLEHSGRQSGRASPLAQPGWTL